MLWHMTSCSSTADWTLFLYLLADSLGIHLEMLAWIFQLNKNKNTLEDKFALCKFIVKLPPKYTVTWPLQLIFKKLNCFHEVAIPSNSAQNFLELSTFGHEQQGRCLPLTTEMSFYVVKSFPLICEMYWRGFGNKRFKKQLNKYFVSTKEQSEVFHVCCRIMLPN